MSKMIPLTRGLFALVDEEDFAELSQHQWQAHEVSEGYIVASRTVYASGHQTTIYLHRQILGAAKGQQVDHINRNTLDNRRENLRIATASLNQVNRPHFRKGYRGVSPKRERWRAECGAGGKQHYLGTFDTEVEAAQAYDAFAREHHGAFAQLNFPDAGVC